MEAMENALALWPLRRDGSASNYGDDNPWRFPQPRSEQSRRVHATLLPMSPVYSVTDVAGCTREVNLDFFSGRLGTGPS